MKNKKILTSFVSVAILSMGLSNVSVMAGGMPDIPPPEERTPLDEALLDIQGIDASEDNVVVEEPVSLTPPNTEDIEVPMELSEPVAVEPPKIEEINPQAVDMPAPENREVRVQPNSSFFGLSVGMYDAFTHDKLATSFNMEYQAGVRILGVLQPIFGAMITTQGTVYGYGGVGVPIDVTDRIFLMPSVAIGGYSEGDGYDLRETLAYRIGAEIGWKLQNNSRIGLNAHVITNGRSFDRKDRTEVIGITYTTPLQYSKN